MRELHCQYLPMSCVSLQWEEREKKRQKARERKRLCYCRESERDKRCKCSAGPTTGLMWMDGSIFTINARCYCEEDTCSSERHRIAGASAG